MKTTIQKAMSTALMIVALTSSVWAHAKNTKAPLEGSHRGRTATGQTIDLLMRPVPGRDGSYLGVMVERGKNEQTKIYMIDPVDTGAYAMTPIGKTEDGELGIASADPTLVLGLGPKGRFGRPTFTLSPANGDQAGKSDSNSVIFNGKHHSNLVWIPIEEGVYKKGRFEDGNVTIAALDSDHQGTVTAAGLTGIAGTFRLREKMPWIYALTGDTVTSTGIENSAEVARIVVFVRDLTLLNKDYIMMLGGDELKLRHF